MDSIREVSFSVIIPTKNEEKQLSKCLETIFHQDTNLPYEVIIVDSSNTRQTREIGESFNAIVIDEPRKGKGIAVNAGAKKAHGKILCFTEADCRVPTHWLTTIYNEFQHKPDTVAVVGDYEYHDSNWFYNLLAKLTFPLSIWSFYIIYHNHSIRCTNFAVRASTYLQAGEFSLSAKELQDVELGLRLGKFGKIRYVPMMKVKTSARRVQGRLFTFIKEFIQATYRLLILKQVPEEPMYEDIR